MKHLDSWTRYLTAQEYAPNTVDLYAVCVKNCLDEVFAKAGIDEPESVTSDMMEDWMIAHHDWSASSKRYQYSAIRSFFSYLVDKNIMHESPAGILHVPKTGKKVDESQMRGKEDRVYSPESLKAMLDYESRFNSSTTRDQAIIALMAATGMRASEVAWLTIGQYKNRQGNTIFARRKGQSIRRIVIAEFAIPYIERYLNIRMREPGVTEDSPLFMTREHNPIDRHTIYNLLATRQKALGLRTGTHNMRYTVINAVERSANPVVARDIAGQKSIAITNNYLVSNEEERKSAIDALPWNDLLSVGNN